MNLLEIMLKGSAQSFLFVHFFLSSSEFHLTDLNVEQSTRIIIHIVHCIHINEYIFPFIVMAFM